MISKIDHRFSKHEIEAESVTADIQSYQPKILHDQTEQIVNSNGKFCPLNWPPSKSVRSVVSKQEMAKVSMFSQKLLLKVWRQNYTFVTSLDNVLAALNHQMLHCFQVYSLE